MMGVEGCRAGKERSKRTKGKEEQEGWKAGQERRDGREREEGE